MTITATTAQERMARAKEAARSVGLLSDAEKARALGAIADAVDAATAEIVAANAEDLARGRESGLSDGLLDRLRLDDARVRALASAVRDVALLPDPVGRVLDEAASVRDLARSVTRLRESLGGSGTPATSATVHVNKR